MSMTLPPSVGLLLALLVLGAAFPCWAGADDATLEHARLAAALRHLDAIERLVTQDVAPPRNESARYHFDYARLGADLKLVRAGIRDYLTPPRAQPRDPIELLSDYRQPDRPSDEEGSQ